MRRYQWGSQRKIWVDILLDKYAMKHMLSFSFLLSSLHIAAGMHDISREDSDAFALRSQQLWGKAHEAGVFKGEIGIFTITFLIIV